METVRHSRVLLLGVVLFVLPVVRLAVPGEKDSSATTPATNQALVGLLSTPSTNAPDQPHQFLGIRHSRIATDDAAFNPANSTSVNFRVISLFQQPVTDPETAHK